MTAAGSPTAAQVAERPAPGSRSGGRQRSSRSSWGPSLAVGCGLTLALRVATEVAALVARYGSGFAAAAWDRPGRLVEVWDQWDVVHYVGIAQHGYPAPAPGGRLPAQIAFAPFYPWVVRAVRDVTTAGWIASALLVSLVATAAGLTGLHRLVLADHGRSAAWTTVLVLVCFPSAFFLVNAYPQSLGLALVVWAFLAARRGRFVVAGLLVACAALTEYYLAITALALVVEVWPPPAIHHRWRRALGRLGALVVPVLAAAVGVAAWGARRYHDALAVVHVQARWERHLSWPWQSYARNLHDVVSLKMLTFVGTPMELADLIVTAVLGVVALWCLVAVRRSYGVLLLLAWLVFSCQTVLVSETREVLVLFPFFLTPAVWLWRHRLVRLAVVAGGLVGSWLLIERFVTALFAG